MIKKQIETMIDLLVEFDEMGFIPTTTHPLAPEEYAIEWHDRMAKALTELEKQLETCIKLHETCT